MVAEFASKIELHAAVAPEPKDDVFIESEIARIKSAIEKESQKTAMKKSSPFLCGGLPIL
jgi:hypothetical protein